MYESEHSIHQRLRNFEKEEVNQQVYRIHNMIREHEDIVYTLKKRLQELTNSSTIGQNPCAEIMLPNWYESQEQRDQALEEGSYYEDGQTY